MLLSTIGGDFEVPPEWSEYRFCREFGVLPHQLDDMPEETYRLYTEFMRLEERSGRMRGEKA